MHTSAIKIAYAAETNFACGNDSVSTVKYACNAFTAGEVADLTVMNAPYSSSPSLGLSEVERKKLRPIGRGVNYVKVLDVGYNYKEFTYTQAIQNDTFIQAAILPATGIIPPSYVFHFEIPGVDGAMDYFDVCGCVLQKYEVKMGDGGDWPTEVLTFLYYDVVDSVAVTNLAAPLDTQPTIKAEIKLWVTDVGGLYTDLSTLNLTIENTLIDKKIAGKKLRQDPSLIYRDISGDFEFTTDIEGILGDSLARNAALTALQTWTMHIAIWAATNALKMTNMRISGDNLGEIPDTTESILFKVDFEQGGDCAFTYEGVPA